MLYVYFFYLVSPALAVLSNELQQFPLSIQGSWYSYEDGEGKEYIITPHEVVGWSPPLVSVTLRYDVRDYLFRRNSGCFVCSRYLVRSWNILERFDSECESLNVTNDLLSTLEKDGCAIFQNQIEPTSIGDSMSQRGYMMFRAIPSPVNCRHSIYGSFNFAYQVRESFTGECQSYKSHLHSCNKPGTQFALSDQKFLLNFGKCEGMGDSFDRSGEFTCLGEWRSGLEHFFVAANLRESRKEERYKCFLRDRQDPYYVGMSETPSCQKLMTAYNSPVRLRLEPYKQFVMPTCLFPANISGTFVSSGIGEPKVFINSTHLIETRMIGYQLRKDVHVCIQAKGHRYQLAKVSEEGCQVEYMCWNLLPRHQNIVRYRKSKTLIKNTFEVCDFANFGSTKHWKYDTLIVSEPNAIECPFSGRFTFGQKGYNMLTPKVLEGVTQSPLDSYRCNERKADFAVCDGQRKNIIIDLDLCFTLNKDGQPIEIRTVPDYRLECVGFWKEDLFSYLITHDPSDSVSRFKCWVYQRISLTEIRLSQALGSACGLHQTFTSHDISEGASVALNLTLNERLYDACPLFYDDGSNPWQQSTSTLKVFHFVNGAYSNQRSNYLVIFIVILSLNLSI